MDITRLHLGGQDYVVLPESEYERLAAIARHAATPEGTNELAMLAELSPLAVTDGSLGRRLADRRRQTGLTQAALAEQAGVRVETLNRIERGRTTPDFTTIRKLVVAIRAAIET